MKDAVDILAISGSLRAGSFNTALLHAAQKHAPDGVRITLYERLGDLPHYNQDLDTDTPPEPVADLRAAINEADALLIASPEYNYSVPGALKNALDWASRPNPGSSLFNKDVAVLGASPGNFGTARGQLALRQVLAATRSRALLHPEVLVFGAHQRCDAAGIVTDEVTIELLRDLVSALRDQVLRSRH